MARSKDKTTGQPLHHLGFPSFNHYNIAIKYLAEQGLDSGCIMPPPETKSTLHYGELNSPDYVCAPFKHLLGSMIELLEAGADVLFMTGGPCRLAFFGELMEKILRDLGYEFTMLNLESFKDTNVKGWLELMRSLNPDAKIRKILPEVRNTLKMVEYLDEIEALYHKNMGFETVEGSYERAFREFKLDMEMATCGSDIREAYHKAKMTMDAIPLRKPELPLRVGIVGEYFTIMDAYSNLGIEDKLCKMGVEVSRFMNFSNYNLHGSEKKLQIRARDYAKYYMGPTSATTVAMAQSYAKLGYDGIIHVKSFGCTPEVDVMPLLQRVSSDYKVPILYLSYDTQTSDTGLDTRLEAFYDMIAMKKKVLKN